MAPLLGTAAQPDTGGTAAQAMIMWIPQLIRCGIHMKTKIGAIMPRPPRERRSRPRPSPRTALTHTAHH